MEISTLALKTFYETHKEEYYARRNSGDLKQWDEQYKWDILPALNEKLMGYKSITRDNVHEFMDIITNNSNKSNFAHWIDMDDLKLLAELNYGNQILDIVWQTSNETVDKDIEIANNTSNSFAPHKKFSPSTWAYILAAKDCSEFSIYRDFIVKKLRDEVLVDEKKVFTPGQKYKLLNDSANYIGELMQADNADESYRFTALNGQDFLWVVLS